MRDTFQKGISHHLSRQNTCFSVISHSFFCYLSLLFLLLLRCFISYRQMIPLRFAFYLPCIPLLSYRYYIRSTKVNRSLHSSAPFGSLECTDRSTLVERM